MNRRRFQARTTGAGAAAIMVWGVALFAGQQTPAAPVFTARQAAEGRGAYDANCASCHMPDLSGNNDAPPLAGANFVSTWGRRSTKELFDYVAASMPPAGSSMGPDVLASIVSHILATNGAAAGAQVFVGSTAVPIASLTTSAAAGASGGQAAGPGGP